MKKTLAFILALVMVLSVSAAAFAEPSGKVMLYSSMQEAQLQAIEQAFEAKYPTVDMEYYYASGGKLVTKMTTEAQDGGHSRPMDGWSLMFPRRQIILRRPIWIPMATIQPVVW